MCYHLKLRARSSGNAMCWKTARTYSLSLFIPLYGVFGLLHFLLLYSYTYYSPYIFDSIQPNIVYNLIILLFRLVTLPILILYSYSGL